ncbi:MAG: ornithine cyclodeaminase family protein [Deltaproteobacteria bacterium]|nr:ornithine cyclodeaminase family protein [Deltaproteobacteria bacterium]
MKPNRLLYLSQKDVVSVGLTMTEIIETLEVAFREKGRGNTEMPPKPGIHPGGEDNFIHAMPAYIPALNAAGVKWVSGFPGNQKKGLPYITGLLILNDPETGIPISVMDCVWITAVRTGAATALSARHLARPESSVVGVLGCGVQGRTNLEALNTLFPLKRVMAYDVNTEAVRGYADEIGSRLNLEVIPVGIPREAVTGCDIVVTAGPILKSPHATIQTGWLDEGAFASLVDFDSYWHPDAMQAAAKFCTDDTPQLRQYQQMADLGELVTGQKPGRETSAERTLTANLGLAIDDMAVAPIIFHKAVEKELGTWLPL